MTHDLTDWPSIADWCSSTRTDCFLWLILGGIPHGSEIALRREHWSTGCWRGHWRWSKKDSFVTSWPFFSILHLPELSMNCDSTWPGQRYLHIVKWTCDKIKSTEDLRWVKAREGHREASSLSPTKAEKATIEASNTSTASIVQCNHEPVQ